MPQKRNSTYTCHTRLAFRQEVKSPGRVYLFSGLAAALLLVAAQGEHTLCAWAVPHCLVVVRPQRSLFCKTAELCWCAQTHVHFYCYGAAIYKCLGNMYAGYVSLPFAYMSFVTTCPRRCDAMTYIDVHCVTVCEELQLCFRLYAMMKSMQISIS